MAGVGLTGYGNGVCLVDENGEPTYKAVVSTDERADDICSEFAETGVERAIYPMTCQSTWAAQPAAMLVWFKRNMPEVLERTRWCLGIKDYVRFRLTGAFTTEMTEASSTCLLNLHTREFDPAIFEALGIPELIRLMPPVCESCSVAGTISAQGAKETGLVEGTPVAAGYFDIDAAEFASGVADTETLCLIAGTWSINERLAREANTDYDKNKNTVTLGYRPGFFNIEESWPTSASNFDWFVSNLLSSDDKDTARSEIYAKCNAAVAELDPNESDVVFVPYLYGASYQAIPHVSICFLQYMKVSASQPFGMCINLLEEILREDKSDCLAVLQRVTNGHRSWQMSWAFLLRHLLIQNFLLRVRQCPLVLLPVYIVTLMMQLLSQCVWEKQYIPVQSV